jgi:hypothetical protein
LENISQYFTFSSVNRLISAVTAGSAGYAKWGLSESFDRYGNRTAQSILSGCQAPMTCPTNSLSFSSPTGGALTNRPDGYSFDPSGNMLSEGANTLTYDAENCLISAGPGTYTCDSHGVRVKKALQGGTTTASAGGHTSSAAMAR